MKFLHCFNFYKPIVVPLYGVNSIEVVNIYSKRKFDEPADLFGIVVKTYDKEIDVTPTAKKSECDAQIYISHLMQTIKRAPEWSVIRCYRNDEIDCFIEGE
jgi:hypothetical protein